jgi:hypothetical protein
MQRACSTLRDVLSLSSAHRTENVTVNMLRNAALLFARVGHPATAASLLGAAEATGHLGGGHTLVVEEALSCIAEALPAPETAAALEAGRALSLAAAAALALRTLAVVEAAIGLPAADASTVG